MALEGVLTGGLPPAAGLAEWFDAAAEAALRGSELVAAGVRFEILEVEFYLRREGHEDDYVHGAPAQRETRGEWYFHREKAARLGFTLKGLDVTFGRPGAEAGGMLIRALAPAGGGPPVEGPSRCVDAVLRAADVAAVSELKALPAYTAGAFAAGAVLRIEGRAAPEDGPMWIGPRVGLKGGRSYAEAPYRYRVRPGKGTKDKKKLRVLAARQSPEPAPGLFTESTAIARPEPGPECAAGPTAAPPLFTDAEFDAFLASVAGFEPDWEGFAAPPGAEPAAVPPAVWGVVGYRGFTDAARFAAEMARLIAARGAPARIVSGGAPGADTLAREWAARQRIAFHEHKPAVAGQAWALLARNGDIVRDSTLVVAFLSPKSRGTHDTLRKARAAGVPAVVIAVD